MKHMITLDYKEFSFFGTCYTCNLQLLCSNVQVMVFFPLLLPLCITDDNQPSQHVHEQEYKLGNNLDSSKSSVMEPYIYDDLINPQDLRYSRRKYYCYNQNTK